MYTEVLILGRDGPASDYTNLSQFSAPVLWHEGVTDESSVGRSPVTRGGQGSRRYR